MVPASDGKRLKSLQSLITRMGQLHPITTYEDQILDGRARFRILSAMGRVPRVSEFKGDDPVAFVLENNRSRFSASQRAMLVNQLATAYHRPMRTLLRAADVSETSAQRALRVIKYGTEQQIEAIVSGRETLNGALDKMARRAPQKLVGLVKPISAPKERRTLRIPAELWAHLREAFEQLNSLPRAQEVAREVAKLSNVGKIVDQKLPIFRNWLAEFESEWARIRAASAAGATGPAAAGCSSGSGDDDPGDGAQPAKVQQG